MVSPCKESVTMTKREYAGWIGAQMVTTGILIFLLWLVCGGCTLTLGAKTWEQDYSERENKVRLERDYGSFNGDGALHASPGSAVMD